MCEYKEEVYFGESLSVQYNMFINIYIVDKDFLGDDILKKKLKKISLILKKYGVKNYKVFLINILKDEKENVYRILICLDIYVSDSSFIKILSKFGIVDYKRINTISEQNSILDSIDYDIVIKKIFSRNKSYV